MIDKKAYQKMDYALCLQRLHHQFIPSGDQQLPCKVYHCRQS